MTENKKLNSVIDISVKGDNKLYVTKDHKVYENNGFGKPKLLEFGDKVLINSICASYTFVHFLSTSGVLYSKGSNIHGQLGLGFASENAIEKPTVNSFFKAKKEMI